jgi:hypothetical protein
MGTLPFASDREHVAAARTRNVVERRHYVVQIGMPTTAAIQMIATHGESLPARQPPVGVVEGLAEPFRF